MRIMRNGVIVNPPHDFKQPSCWYFRVQEGLKQEFIFVTYGVTSIPNLMNFRPTIV
jgi:hypothetical protein